jgi:hypothetical protein
MAAPLAFALAPSATSICFMRSVSAEQLIDQRRLLFSLLGELRQSARRGFEQDDASVRSCLPAFGQGPAGILPTRRHGRY